MKGLATLMFAIGATAFSLILTAGFGLAAVAFLFCDAPGSTPLQCMLSGATAGVTHTAPLLLPVAGVALLLGGALRHWSRR
jgi:hypothetical protein